jgi:integrase
LAAFYRRVLGEAMKAILLRYALRARRLDDLWIAHEPAVRTPAWRACRKAGLRQIGWHVLRHTFASHFVMRGAAMKVVQELLGHATIEMTMRYAHCRQLAGAAPESRYSKTFSSSKESLMRSHCPRSGIARSEVAS